MSGISIFLIGLNAALALVAFVVLRGSSRVWMKYVALGCCVFELLGMGVLIAYSIDGGSP